MMISILVILRSATFWPRGMLISGLAIASVGCDPGARQRVAALEQEVTQLKQVLNEQRQGLDTERQTLQAFMNAADAVTLKPTDQGFDALWHDLGVFAVELPFVTATEKGSRVTVRLGNLTAGAVNNVEAKVEWGTDPNAPPPRSERMFLVRIVPQGGWAETSLDLDGVPPDRLGFVRLSEVRIGSVSLRQPAGRPSRP
jgi:Protein of unknown function (DUF3251)